MADITVHSYGLDITTPEELRPIILEALGLSEG